jgi:hypothetical protein
MARKGGSAMAQIKCGCCGDVIEADDPLHCKPIPDDMKSLDTCPEPDPEPACGKEYAFYCPANGVRRCWAGHHT